MTVSTPFAKWRELGEQDPHGERYNQGVEVIASPQHCSELVAISLITGRGLMFIVWLTAGKERLRWLSRKLYKMTNDHQRVNEHRAKLTRGDLTDDELANAFFLSESNEDLQAGHDRIMWLLSEIKKIS